RRQHVRRSRGDQPVRRAPFQGPPLGCDRAGTVRRTHMAASRRRGPAPSRRCLRSPPTQRGPRRCGCRHVVRESELTMALDAAEAKAVSFDPFTMTIERGRLMFFATATGQMDPTYVDLGRAQRAGHRDLPVPPSFFFSAELEQPDPFGWLVALGV